MKLVLKFLTKIHVDNVDIVINLDIKCYNFNF